MEPFSSHRINAPGVLILFLSLLLVEAQAQGKKAPIWVSEMPYSSQAYYGLGIAATKGQQDYRTIARKMALRDIAEKIYVSINSVSALTLNHEEDKTQYRLAETVEPGNQ